MYKFKNYFNFYKKNWNIIITFKLKNTKNIKLTNISVSLIYFNFLQKFQLSKFMFELHHISRVVQWSHLLKH